MSEVPTELSHKDIVSIVDSWQELARVLNMGGAMSEDCRVLLQDWVKQNQEIGDKRGRLAELFRNSDYHNMSTIILEL